MSGARAAFDTVGDDDLTDEQLARLMEQLAANALDHGDDPGYLGVLEEIDNSVTLDEQTLLARLGLDGDGGDDTLAFEARWGEDA